MRIRAFVAKILALGLVSPYCSLCDAGILPSIALLIRGGVPGGVVVVELLTGTAFMGEIQTKHTF